MSRANAHRADGSRQVAGACRTHRGSGLYRGAVASFLVHSIVLFGLSMAVVRTPFPNSSAVVQIDSEMLADEAEELVVTQLDLPPVEEDPGRSDFKSAEELIQTSIAKGKLVAGSLDGDDSAFGPLGSGLGKMGEGPISVIRRRLARFSKTAETDYDITLVWDGPSNLDLFVVFPSGTYVDGWYNFGRHEGGCPTIISWNRGREGVAFLDIVSNNWRPYTNEPIEHIYLDSSQLPSGEYRVFVYGQKLRPASARLKPPQSLPYSVQISSPAGVQLYSREIEEGELHLLESPKLRGAR